jgi:hypothetical protein
VGGKPLESEGKRCENRTNMSATVVREKRQTTLPADVCQAAGIRINDLVDWRFEEGEIRGRKLVPAQETVRQVHPIQFKELLILPQHLEVDLERLDEELKQEREELDEHLLDDLMHARSAVLAGVDLVLTRNPTDFSGLTGEILIEKP